MCKTTFLSVLLVGLAAGQEPPRFGTVLQRWSLQMSGAYAGAGITWVRDSGRFYLMDQGYAGPSRVWRLDPADPENTIEAVPWTFANLGDSTVDIPWGIAWDADSGCFWTSQIVDGNIHGGCCLLRHIWSGSTWAWGGAPGDSWLVGDGRNRGGLECLWTAGMERNVLTGIYYFMPVHTSPSPMNHVGRFDPYTKTGLGRLPNGDTMAGRGLTLVPWDSAYVLASGWNTLGLVKMDSLGRVVQRADSNVGGPCDIALLCPQTIRQEDTVFFYMLGSNPSNYFSKISAGLVWSQLGSVGVEEKRLTAHGRQQTATLARSVLMYQPTAGSSQMTAELLDITGRRVLPLQPGANDIRQLSPGIYFIRREQDNSTAKVVVQH
jgi:hypothetical protein